MNQKISNTEHHASQSELGKKSAYDTSYDPSKLFAISREDKRKEIGVVPTNLPFAGYDYWNHYEVSWLNLKGKPMVGIGEIFYDCTSPNLVESKSLKLYFNSFNNTKIESIRELENTIQKDLSACLGTKVIVSIHLLDNARDHIKTQPLTGECIDDLDIECSQYIVEPKLLTTHDNIVAETLFSNLLKSNCLVTHQPDWGSVQIAYQGKQIDREGLLQYIVSFRNHNEFHEQCIERIFVDIMEQCQPEQLTVYGRYTRRGGLDINPFRTTKNTTFTQKNNRLIRQ